MRKSLVALLFFGSTFFSASAQFTIDAGFDLTICTHPNDSVSLGAFPVATGGAAPYTYQWKVIHSPDPTQSGNVISTLANPMATLNFSPTSGQAKFSYELTVTDNLGATLIDTVNIRVSSFTDLLVMNGTTITQGDTTVLNSTSVGGGISPYTYSWSPNYNISDVSIEHPSAWPDVDTEYHLLLTDSVGCTSDWGQFMVYVTPNPNGVEETNSSEIKAVVYPNPITENSGVLIEGADFHNQTISVYDMNGRLVFSDKFGENKTYKLGKKVIEKGVYQYSISIENQVVYSGQFVK